MKKLLKTLKQAIFCLIIFTVICGILYTCVVTGIAQLIFQDKANGSIITITLNDGTKKEIGSELIAQEFIKPKYLIGRPQGTSNMSPVSEEQIRQVVERVKWQHDFDPDNKAEIPSDLVTASGSGVDPNISPAAAEYQVSRIAKARDINEDVVRNIINHYTTSRFLGFWGEPAVNVLKVNLALDGLL